MPLTLAAATATGTGFNWTGLIIVAVVVVAVYPLQKWLRRTVSEQRRERWAREEEAERAGSSERQTPPEPGGREPS